MSNNIRKVFRLGARDREVIELQAEKKGTVTVSVSWSGGPNIMAVDLIGPGQVGNYATWEGYSPITLTYNLSSQDLARGKQLKVAVVNLTNRSASQVTAVIDFPGSEAGVELPSKFEALRSALYNRLKSVTPKIRSTTLTILPRDISIVKLKMAEVQLLLKNAVVKDISKAGTLSISKNIIVRPGVMKPRDLHIHGSPTSNELRLYGTLANRIVFSPPLLGGEPPLPGDEIPQDEAVLIGTKVDLANSKLIISENVTTLSIITPELVAGPMAKITPRLVILPKPKSYNYPQRQHASGFRNYNPTVETPASKFRSPSGSHGGKGADGANGYYGNAGNDGNDEKPAPSVEIITLAFNGVPEINLRGAPGGPGENGQRGENGGHGAKGLHSTCKGGFCHRGVGHGGDGGNGGDGGKAGDGGLGGPGGNISIMSTYDGMRMFGEAPKIFIISGGIGGPGGKGGAGGNRGLGGDHGKTSTCFIKNCDKEPTRKGENGES